MKPTIKDVAKKSNVSIATVSKILNGLGGYSEETERRVLKTIKEIGYSTNAMARGLATKSSNILGLMIPDAATTFYGEVIKGIEETAHNNGYSVIVCNTGDNGIKALQYLKILISYQVAGIIYVSSPLFDEYSKLISKMNIPCVLAVTASNKYQMPYVKVDDKQAAYTATKYLIENGHKKIAMISGTESDPIAGKPRVDGYIEALTDYGLEVNNNLIVYGNFTYEAGELCMNKLLDEGREFTAIFAASDDMAVGALNVAHSRGIKVPDELSIIGYDNTKAAKMCFPQLTTIMQPLFEIGQKATNKLFEIINGNTMVENSIIRHEIIVRDTVRKI